MIEKPLIIKNIFKSRENILEFLRRILCRYSTVMNERNKVTVTKKQYNSYFKFTFIRNPWARAYSWYENVMRDEIHKKDHKITRKISLNEFLRLYAGKGILKPQTYWIKDFSGTIPLDYIGRYENLIEDFQKIRTAINIHHITLPHILMGSGNDYREHYDEDSINIIMEVYKEEIGMFGYHFEL